MEAVIIKLALVSEYVDAEWSFLATQLEARMLRKRPSNDPERAILDVLGARVPLWQREWTPEVLLVDLVEDRRVVGKPRKIRGPATAISVNADPQFRRVARRVAHKKPMLCRTPNVYCPDDIERIALGLCACPYTTEPRRNLPRTTRSRS
jgi:hypothetical protein